MLRSGPAALLAGISLILPAHSALAPWVRIRTRASWARSWHRLPAFPLRGALRAGRRGRRRPGRGRRPRAGRPEAEEGLGGLARAARSPRGHTWPRGWRPCPRADRGRRCRPTTARSSAARRATPGAASTRSSTARTSSPSTTSTSASRDAPTPRRRLHERHHVGLHLVAIVAAHELGLLVARRGGRRARAPSLDTLATPRDPRTASSSTTTTRRRSSGRATSSRSSTRRGSRPG